MSKPKGDGYVLGFAAVICLTCSVLLAVSESVLKPFKEKNVANDKRFNVLKALGAEVLTADGSRIPPEKVNELYSAFVGEMVLDGATGKPLEGVLPGTLDPEEINARKKLPLYIRKDEAATR
jgi:Na+-transporting NADH:ubiquinone oxidoreductase subunit NqrC